MIEFSRIISQDLTAAVMKTSACYLLHANLQLALFFYLEDGGDMFIRNVV
jgi:hypothetical protein